MAESAGDAEDLYATLGVPEGAPLEEIRAAYRTLAQRYHPDHNPGDREAVGKMRAINEAFAVLNVPERRKEYDRRRALARQGGPVEAKRGAGRGQRPYYRGKNWGMHTGADAPPDYIVRASPSGFNLVVGGANEVPAREISVHNDAPFKVRIAVVPSPWLLVSTPLLEIEGDDSASVLVGITPAAAQQLRGWRDGGVSLITDDPRVFCPDVRVTAIFLDLAHDQPPAPDAAASSRTTGPDLREVDQAAGGAAAKRGWRRLFGP